MLFIYGHVFIGSIGKLVHRGAGVRPKISKRPEEASKKEGEQTQGMNRISLGVLSALSNGIGQDMDIPKASNKADGQNDEHYPRDDIGKSINHFWWQKGGV